jgi:hypothetical protein
VTVTNTGDSTAVLRDIDSKGADVIDGQVSLGPGESTAFTVAEGTTIALRLFDGSGAISPLLEFTTDCDDTVEDPNDPEDPDPDPDDPSDGDGSASAGDLSATWVCTVDGVEVTVTNDGDSSASLRDIDSKGADVIDGQIPLGPGESTTVTVAEGTTVALRLFDGNQAVSPLLEFTADCDDTDPDPDPDPNPDPEDPDPDPDPDPSDGDGSASAGDLSATWVCTADDVEITVTNDGDATASLRDIDSKGADVIDGQIPLGPGESTIITVTEGTTVALRLFDGSRAVSPLLEFAADCEGS